MLRSQEFRSNRAVRLVTTVFLFTDFQISVDVDA